MNDLEADVDGVTLDFVLDSGGDVEESRTPQCVELGLTVVPEVDAPRKAPQEYSLPFIKQHGDEAGDGFVVPSVRDAGVANHRTDSPIGLLVFRSCV